MTVKKATGTIPMVFSSGGDPAKLGLVQSHNHPNGNATGVFVLVSELGPKRLQLLREAVPNVKLIAYIVNLNSGTGRPQLQQMQTVAQTMGQQLLVLSASTERQIDDAFASIVEHRAGAILYSAGVFFQVMRNKLVTLAARHSIPAIYEWPEFVTSGGLMSYSTDRAEAGRQMGIYTGQILKGVNPANLPVVQSTKFDFVINLKTAKTLGLTLSSGLLSIADEVIE
jgi:putative ABC transport system substrate-binding protein